MIAYRPLRPADLPQLLDWLQRPHVKQWWDDGDDTLEKVAARYADHSDDVRRFIVEVDGRDAGYFQYYRIGPRAVGCDQFLSEAAALSKGLGTRCLRAFTDLIAAAEAPDSIAVDPHPTNHRAIRCYKKCGFVHRPAQSTAEIYFMALDCRLVG